MNLTDPTAALIEARRAQPAPRIVRAEDKYLHRQLLDKRVPIAEWAWWLYPPVFVDRPIPDLSRRGELDANVTTLARVEHGRWYADCPFCASGQVVSPTDPRFLCAGSDGCANGQIKGAFAQVVFPQGDEREQAEPVLLARPAHDNRNWLPPRESVADLIAENNKYLGPGWKVKS